MLKRGEGKLRALEFLASSSGKITAEQLGQAMGFASRSHASVMLYKLHQQKLVQREILVTYSLRKPFLYWITQRGLDRLAWFKTKKFKEEAVIV